MYRMAVILMIMPIPEGIDKSRYVFLYIWTRTDFRCVMMALVHDMAESLVGDITPFDGISKGPNAPYITKY